jgi:chemotaxis protein MotB
MRRKKKAPEHVNHERWLVSYADFITLLFAFFTTLYAISTVDQKKAGKLQFSMMSALNLGMFHDELPPQGPPVNLQPLDLMHGGVMDKGSGSGDGTGAGSGTGGTGGSGYTRAALEQLAKELEKMSADPELLGRVLVKLGARGVTISLSEAGFFETGRAELGPGALAALDVIARRLASKRGLETVVEGHTDDRPVRGGTYSSNWELSTARATTVVAHLIDVDHLDPATVSAAGYAEFHPAASNATAEGRTRNRRVDIIVRPLKMIDGPPASPPPAGLTTPEPETEDEGASSP